MPTRRKCCAATSQLLATTATLTALVVQLPGCVVTERCFGAEDCPLDQRCDRQIGLCVFDEPAPADLDLPLADAATGDEDADASSADATTPVKLHCDLEAMALVANRFCVDVWEASRPDATDDSPGNDDSRAVSQPGVIPWQVDSNAEAAAACAAAGKRLCRPAEWQQACQGPEGTTYAYGDTYDPKICNGIDAFGDASSWSFHLAPTGDFQGCTNDWGIFDLNGNIWEHTADGDGTAVRGGAFNCKDSRTLHRCDYVPATWTPTALGFRCCADAVVLQPAPTDGGPTDGGPTDGPTGGPTDGGHG